MQNELQQNLASLLTFRTQLEEKLIDVQNTIETVNKSINALELQSLKHDIELFNAERLNMTPEEAIVDFGESIELFTKETPVKEKQSILLNFLTQQFILNYFIMYKENGVDLINELIDSINNIKN